MCGNFICENYDNLAFLKKVAGSGNYWVAVDEVSVNKKDCKIVVRDKVKANLDIWNFEK